MVINFKGAHFPREIILACVRWYIAHPLSTCPVEEPILESISKECFTNLIQYL
jgi:transposase-like protein